MRKNPASIRIRPQGVMIEYLYLREFAGYYVASKWHWSVKGDVEISATKGVPH